MSGGEAADSASDLSDLDTKLVAALQPGFDDGVQSPDSEPEPCRDGFEDCGVVDAAWMEPELPERIVAFLAHVAGVLRGLHWGRSCWASPMEI